MLHLVRTSFSDADLRALAAALRPLIDDLDKSPAEDAVPDAQLEGGEPLCMLTDDEGRSYTLPPRLLHEATEYKKAKLLSASLLNIARMLDPLSVQRHHNHAQDVEDLADAIIAVVAYSDFSHTAVSQRRRTVIRLLEKFADARGH